MINRLGELCLAYLHLVEAAAPGSRPRRIPDGEDGRSRSVGGASPARIWPTVSPRGGTHIAGSVQGVRRRPPRPTDYRALRERTK